jgi:hypothetical protein
MHILISFELKTLLKMVAYVYYSDRLALSKGTN